MIRIIFGGLVLTSVIGVVVLLGGLIFFHELGHYLVAKFFRVKVETFSLGFGKKIFKKQWGETEYCLSLVPLGGYVKLMGDDPYKEIPADQAERAFSTQALYKRFLIVAAGPIANLLLAYVLFMVVFWLGQPQVSTRIGSVLGGSPAWDAGIRPGDKIVALNDESLNTWEQMGAWLKPKEGQTVQVTLERDQSQLKIPLKLVKVQLKNAFGEEETVGGIKGISPSPLASVVGVSDPETVAYQAGLRTGDYIKKVGDQTVGSFDELITAISNQSQKSPLMLTYQRQVEGSKTAAEGTVNLATKGEKARDAILRLGFYPSDTFVRQISKDSPAEKGGLVAGDRMVKVGDKLISHFDAVVEAVQEYGAQGATIPVVVERAGKLNTFNLTPIETEQEDPITHQKFKKYMIGFAPYLVYQEPEYTTVTVRGPFALIAKGVGETNELATKMVISLVKLATGGISIKNLGGPVLIATVAGKSLDAGIVHFLQMMALISINLFLLNLFPVPILDGGHLLFFTIEAIKGKPVSLRTMEIANQIGMVFILTLVVLTLFNDISRIILH